MTIYAVTRGRVENGNTLGFKRTEEQILGCREVEPREYNLAHGFVEMDVKVGPDDSVSVNINSIVNPGKISDIKFGGSYLILPGLQVASESLNIIPKWREAALTVGPNKKGITFSLERYSKESLVPVTIGTLAIEDALNPFKPKVNKTIISGGRGSG